MNVYDVPAVRPVNVAEVVGAVIVWVVRPGHVTEYPVVVPTAGAIQLTVSCCRWIDVNTPPMDVAERVGAAGKLNRATESVNAPLPLELDGVILKT